MTSFGSFREEDDSFKDLSVEITSHQEWRERIESQGNKPEEWVEFIEHIKSQNTVPYESFWHRYICDIYVKALKLIPGAFSKNVMFVKLLIDYANLKSENNPDDGQMLFSQARSIARMFSIAHVAAAEFELNHGNKVKCQKILEKAEMFGAQPTALLKEAIQNLKAGKSFLLTPTQKADYFEKRNESIGEKAPLKSSVSLPEFSGSTKNKFLVDMMTSQAPAISRVRTEPRGAAPEKSSQPLDPFSSSEKWVSGGLLSDKWGSCGNFSSSEGRLSSIFSGPDRRMSSIQNVVDRRLSSIHSVTDRRISIMHSAAAALGSSSSSEKGLLPSSSSSSSSLLGGHHHSTPDPHANSDLSGNSSSGGSSISKLLNVSSQLPRRVRIEPKSQPEFDDENDEEDNNTVYNFKSTVTSGRCFSSKFQSAPITEEDDAIDGSRSGFNDHKSTKVDKSGIGSQINGKDHKVKIKSSANGNTSGGKDDFPQLPTPPTLCMSFMRNRGENPPRPLSTSSSLSTSTLSASTPSGGQANAPSGGQAKSRSALSTSTSISTLSASTPSRGQSNAPSGGQSNAPSGGLSKTPSGRLSNAPSGGLSKSRSALDKLLSETDSMLARGNVTPCIFAEPKPVTNFAKPAQPKCHPDTPRPGTGTSPAAAADKETVCAPPSSSLNKLISDASNMLASRNLTPHVFAEPKPVATLAKPPQPKCHPDTPRPGTGTPPLADDKENFVAPPLSSRRCLRLNPFDPSPPKTGSPATCDSLTLSETLKSCTVTVRENINDTVLFEGKPAEDIQAPSALATPTKSKTYHESPITTLPSVSSITQRPATNQYDNADELDSARYQPDPSSASTDKENLQPSSCPAPAILITKSERSRPYLQEKVSEPAAVVTPVPKPAKSESRHCDYPAATERVKPIAAAHTVGKPEQAKLLVDTPHQVGKHQAFSPPEVKVLNPPTKGSSDVRLKELPVVDKSVISESNPRVNPVKANLLREQLVSVENLPRSKYEKPERNSDKHRSVQNSSTPGPVALAPKTEQRVQRSPGTCDDATPQPLMDKGGISKDPELASSKAQRLSYDRGQGDKVQIEKQPSIPPQPRPETPPQPRPETPPQPRPETPPQPRPQTPQQRPPQEKPIPQQNREITPKAANSNGPVTYQMSLNQPIQGAKKHRSLTVNDKTYMILKMVGRGGSSKVYRVLDQSYNMLAVKHIDLEGATEALIQTYMNEVTLLKRLQSSDLVIKLHDYELDYTENCLYLVLECGETDLANMLKNRTRKSLVNKEVPREMVKFYWGEMLRAVQVLHREGIVHSDLKPANFLIVGGNLKLIDFGIAGLIQNDRTSMTRDTQMGTLNYMSPETILEMQSDTGSRLHKFKISVKSDVWSLGCILYSMIYGKTPFQQITNATMKLQAIINPNHHIEFGDEYDTDLLDTIKRCLRRNPKERLSIDDLLQHPYLVEKAKVSPPEPNVMDSPNGAMNKMVADMQSAFNKLLESNVASPNTMNTLKHTLEQLGSKKDVNKVLSQLPSSKKSVSPDVRSKPEIISKAEPKQKLANGGVKEMRAPLQCLDLKDLRRGEKVSKDSS